MLELCDFFFRINKKKLYISFQYEFSNLFHVYLMLRTDVMNADVLIVC